MKANEFKCSVCEVIFENAWTVEEAKEELAENFPGSTTDECDVVCDDCYKKFMRIKDVENLHELPSLR